MATIIENDRRVYTFSTRLPAELHADLVEYAAKSRRTLSESARMLMEQGIRLARDEELANR